MNGQGRVDKNRFCTQITRRSCQRGPHLSSRVVAHEAHRINRLTCAAGCDHHPQPVQGAAPSDHLTGDFKDFLRLRDPTLPHFAGRQPSLGRADKVDAPVAQGLDIAHCGRVGPHIGLHGRRQQHRSFVAERCDAQQIVAQTQGKAGDRVCCSRRDDKQVGGVGQRYVADPQTTGVVPELECIGRHTALRDSLKGHRCDELGSRVGHYHVHQRIGLCKAAGQCHRLVGRDAAADAEHDAFARENRSH